MPEIELAPDLNLTLAVDGEGPPALVIHGGGGPATVAPLSEHLAATRRTLTPTLPGWDGTPRPDRVDSIPVIAEALLELLRREDLREVLVVGSSIGGWIAAEMAAADAERRIGGLVLVDTLGIEVEGEPVTDFFALDARGVAEHSFYDSERFYVDPSSQSSEQLAAMRANLATLRVVAGDPYMYDPALRARLPQISLATLVIWGEADDIGSPAYGRAFAAALPNARFELVGEAGHLPQIEQPAATNALIDAYLAASG